jgi:hypothetical protein
VTELDELAFNRNIVIGLVVGRRGLRHIRLSFFETQRRSIRDISGASRVPAHPLILL